VTVINNRRDLVPADYYKRLAFPMVVRWELVDLSGRLAGQAVFVVPAIPGPDDPLYEFPLTCHSGKGIDDMSHYSLEGVVCYGNRQINANAGQLLWGTVHTKWDAWFVDRWEKITKAEGVEIGARFALRRPGTRTIRKLVPVPNFHQIPEQLKIGVNELVPLPKQPRDRRTG
jgi:hypothetical protein